MVCGSSCKGTNKKCSKRMFLTHLSAMKAEKKTTGRVRLNGKKLNFVP